MALAMSVRALCIIWIGALQVAPGSAQRPEKKPPPPNMSAAAKGQASSKLLCGRSEYQAELITVNCTGGHDLQTFQFSKKITKLGVFPKGLQGLALHMEWIRGLRPEAIEANELPSIRMHDLSSGACLVGPAPCECTQQLGSCFEGSIEFLSRHDLYGHVIGLELNRYGVMPANVSLEVVTDSVFAFNASIEWAYGRSRCRRQMLGCKDCKDYACPSGQVVAACNGSMTAQCVMDPLSHKWMEYRMGGVQMGSTATKSSSTCPCCHLPINPTPVKIAAPMTLKYRRGRNSAENRPFTVLAALQRFVAWFNQERGGVCLSSERRPVELVVLDTAGDDALHNSAIHHLAQTEDIELFLGPPMYESYQTTQSAAELASNKGVLVLGQGPVPTSSLQGCDVCFSLFPPARTIFEPALALLPSTGPGGRKLRLASMCDRSEISKEACGALPTLAKRYDMNLSTQHSANNPYLPNAMVALKNLQDIDVFVVSMMGNGCYRVASLLAQERGTEAVATFAVILACPCTFDNSFFAFPALSGFVVSMAPWNWWANSTSTAVDISSSWSDAGKFSGLLLRELDPILTTEDGTVLAQVEETPDGNHLSIAEAHLIRNSRNPPAMVAWTALAVLMSAVEGADSADAVAVASYLNSLSGRESNLSTMLGQVVFDSDGHATGSVTALQLQEVRCHSQLKVLPEPRVLKPQPAGGNASLVHLVAPVPTSAHLHCFSQEAEPSEKGFQGGECQKCNADSVGVFDAQLHRRVCQKCPEGTSVQILDAVRRTCERCPGGLSCSAGKELINCVCKPCNPGYVSNETDIRVCQACDRGRFAASEGSTSCDLCEAGKISGDAYAQCISCAAGTVSSAAGQPSCRPCPEGTYAPEPGMTECLGCPEGSKSCWNGIECELCPVGKFQNVPNSSNCVDGDEGATYNSTGMAIGKNKEGYWARVIGSQVTFERCLHGACLEQEKCPKGSAGVQCSACLPGYVRPMPNMDKNCISCDDIKGHMAFRAAVLLLMFLLFLFLGLWIARLALDTKRSPRDLTLAYVKLFIFFIWISAVLGSTLQERLLLERDILGETLTRALINVETFSRLSLVDHAYFSNLISCIIQDWGSLDFLSKLGREPASSHVAQAISKVAPSDLAEDIIVEQLQRLRHSDWFEPSSAPLISWLANRQSRIQCGVIIVWVLLPLVLMHCAYFISFIHVQLVRCMRRKFYADASAFFSDLLERGTRKAISSRTADQWLAYTIAYRSRIALVWSPFIFRERGCCASLSQFYKASTPFLQALFLLLYGFVLDGILLGSKCISFQNETKERAYFASELKCLDLESPDTLFMLGATVVWCLSGPLLIYRTLYRLRQHITPGNEFEPADSVMTFGYCLHCYNWQMYIFCVKTIILIVRPLIQDPADRGHILLGVALLHAGMVLSAQPFTNRSDSALPRADQRLAFYFVMQCFIHEYIQYSQPNDGQARWSIPVEVTQVRYAFLVVMSALLNIWILLFFAFRFYEGFRRRFVEQYEEYEWILWENNKRRGSIFAWFTSMVYKDYIRIREKQPYVCFDPDLGWVTTVGSQGHKAPLVRAHWGAQGQKDHLLDLSEAPSVPSQSEVQVKESTVEQRRKVIECLRRSMESLDAKSGTSGSILQMEFVLRAAFVFARDIELHSKRIARDPALLAAEEQAAGADALQMLMSSFDEDEPPIQKRGSLSMEAEEALSRLPRSSKKSLSRNQTSTRTSSRNTLMVKDVDLRRSHSTQISKMFQQTLEDENIKKKSSNGACSRMFSCSSQRDAALLELCQHFYDDPVRVLHFYSQAEFVRCEEVDRIAEEEWRREHGRESYVQLIRNAYENVSQRVSSAHEAFRHSLHDSEDQNFRASTMRGLKSAISSLTLFQAPPADEIWCQRIVDQMFQNGMFATGMDLESLQLGLVILETCQQQDIRFLQDEFHDRWYSSRLLTDHKIKSYKGFLREQQVQCNNSAQVEENTAESRILQAAKQAERASNRWHYLVLKLVGRNWAEVIMHILPSDMGTLLRARQVKLHQN